MALASINAVLERSTVATAFTAWLIQLNLSAVATGASDRALKDHPLERVSVVVREEQERPRAVHLLGVCELRAEPHLERADLPDAVPTESRRDRDQQVSGVLEDGVSFREALPRGPEATADQRLVYS
jgi:hypothetical protein